MQTSDQYYESGRLKQRTISNLDELGRRYDSEIQEFNEDGTYKNTKFLKSVGGEGVTHQEKVYVSGILQCVKYYSTETGKPILKRVDVFDGKVKVQSIEVYRIINEKSVLDSIEEFTYYVGQTGISFYDVDLEERKNLTQKTYKDSQSDEVLRIEFYTDGDCLSEHIYDKGKKVEAREYGISDEGERYMKKDSFLDSDGNPERIESYKSAGEGKLIHEETIEFEKDPDGVHSIMSVYHPFRGGRELTYKQVLRISDNQPETTEWYKDGVKCQDAKMSEEGLKTVTIYRNEAGEPVPVRYRVYRAGELIEDQPITK